ncbi:MBOAT-domain-containing protein [Gloeophyllum trabeum ATCC 11539]|uniref:MBOAT-domain-containing protein n=1 Tax=Gloeophyllum trabeum (strain ATCC 11539 / FP-39264 / Madison 617) TaxID=670483 RepID=S7Q1S9_GLOTA|nr:MBOAT-domain-containing protein [Gloeophyllum trabeum ATCC 11539]EPQ53946.1 MBOAT-domain-containing protein [Gloeophyllum trabeum ATCC 11539]
MSGEVALQMPTDLRSVSALEGVIRLTVDVPASASRGVSGRKRPAARWRTPEFILYEVLFVIVVPILVWVPVKLSSVNHPNYPLYSHRLSQGWLSGRQVDNSDAQYRSFRNNIPSLGLLIAAFFGFKAVYVFFANYSSLLNGWQVHARRIFFLSTFSVLMLMGLHGSSAIKVLLIITLNYWIAKSFRGSKLTPLLTWVFNTIILFANERNEGYKFAVLHPSLEFLDDIGGAYPRWHVSFNITMLRLVSFNMDYFWACNGTGAADTGSTLDHKKRTTTPHPQVFYGYINYLAYVLYPPLYIAGPIMTFNDFMWQLQRPVAISVRSVVNYAFRFLACLLTMEFILHFMYVVAIKDSHAWQGDSPFELSMIGFWNLLIVWLKLLLPWRLFRLWALMDGIDPPENMVRCMANNYSPLGFWRAWHRSYNLWIVRYIYIPLGGTKNVAFTSVLIFSFVALWHDLSFRLLTWGWLVSLFILPELLARYLFPASQCSDKPWYRHLCAVGAVFNILMMMTANLVGFVIGTDGLSYLLSQLIGTWEGLRFFGVACVCLFIAAQVMFEYREEEMRQGIYRRC